MADSILPPLTFLSYSLGCRTNQAEMESTCLQITDYGLQQWDKSLLPTDYRLPQKAPDIILLNTCVVTQKAEKETRQKIRELRKKYPKSFFVILGCAVTAKEKFKINLPEADLLISNQDKEKTTEIILKKFNFVCGRTKKSTNLSSSNLNKYQLSGRKFIKIQDGCNCGCSFCLTQFLRGKPASVLPEKIIKEINFWVDKGIKEIILTGTNIGLYGKDNNYQRSHLSTSIKERPFNLTRQSQARKGLLRRPSTALGIPRNDIVHLLNKILSETKIERISFSSIYPEMLTDDFLNLVVNNPRVSQYFHLSLQSGSQTVLERMNRETELSRLRQILSKIKKQSPYFTFRADIITGFPNESKEEFKQTLDFLNKVKISHIHSFLFSFRPGVVLEGFLKSGKWKEVTPAVKKQRAGRLRKVVEEIRKEEAKNTIAKSLNCLIIKKCSCVIASSSTSLTVNSAKQSRPRMRLLRRPSTALGIPRNDIEYWEGITENGWTVKIFNDKSFDRLRTGFPISKLKGKIIPVKIKGFEKDYLIGEMTSFPTY